LRGKTFCEGAILHISKRIYIYINAYIINRRSRVIKIIMLTIYIGL
jgi:hypothetical protein